MFIQETGFMKTVLGIPMVLALACSTTTGYGGVDVTGADLAKADVPSLDVPMDQTIADVSSGLCGSFCASVQATCTDANQQYSSVDDCMGDCAKFAPGQPGDTSGNTLQCRIYHASEAAKPGKAALHCPHTGGTGGGVCGTLCDEFCYEEADHCQGANAIFASDAECHTACATIPQTGQDGDATGDTIQCRIYHLGAPAAADPVLHCPHGKVVSAACK